jgi:hypothetical protein
MIDEEHIEPDDDPTIGLKSGKAKASRDSGEWVPWTEEDMAKYRARGPLGTEARFDILHYTHLRLGDASRSGADGALIRSPSIHHALGTIDNVRGVTKIPDGGELVGGPVQQHEIFRPPVRLIRIEHQDRGTSVDLPRH